MRIVARKITVVVRVDLAMKEALENMRERIINGSGVKATTADASRLFIKITPINKPIILKRRDGREFKI